MSGVGWLVFGAGHRSRAEASQDCGDQPGYGAGVSVCRRCPYRLPRTATQMSMKRHPRCPADTKAPLL